MLETVPLFFWDRHTKVPEQPHHPLLVGGESSEHKLRRDVQPSGHHAVEERAPHHLCGGHGQHARAQRQRQVRAGGGYESRAANDFVVPDPGFSRSVGWRKKTKQRQTVIIGSIEQTEAFERCRENAAHDS